MAWVGGSGVKKCNKSIDSALDKLSLDYYEYTHVKMPKWLLNLAPYKRRKIKYQDYIEKLKEIEDFQRIPLFAVDGDVAKEHIVKESLK